MDPRPGFFPVAKRRAAAPSAKSAAAVTVPARKKPSPPPPSSAAEAPARIPRAFGTLKSGNLPAEKPPESKPPKPSVLPLPRVATRGAAPARGRKSHAAAVTTAAAPPRPASVVSGKTGQAAAGDAESCDGQVPIKGDEYHGVLPTPVEAAAVVKGDSLTDQGDPVLAPGAAEDASKVKKCGAALVVAAATAVKKVQGKVGAVKKKRLGMGFRAQAAAGSVPNVAATKVRAVPGTPLAVMTVAKAVAGTPIVTLSNAKGPAAGTPYLSARNCSKCRVDRLESAGYWLSQIRLAESVGKHRVAAEFFRLALECQAQPLHWIKGELWHYMDRHPSSGDLKPLFDDLLKTCGLPMTHLEFDTDGGLEAPVPLSDSDCCQQGCSECCESDNLAEPEDDSRCRRTFEEKLEESLDLDDSDAHQHGATIEEKLEERLDLDGGDAHQHGPTTEEKLEERSDLDDRGAVQHGLAMEETPKESSDLDEGNVALSAMPSELPQGISFLGESPDKKSTIVRSSSSKKASSVRSGNPDFGSISGSGKHHSKREQRLASGQMQKPCG